MPSPPRGFESGAAPSPGTEPAPRERIPAIRKLGYGVGNIAYSLPYQAAASFFMFFATVILKIPPLPAGIAVALSIVWDAAMDTFIGYASDNTAGGRLGRRHPYILAGALLLAVSSFFLWRVSAEASLTVRFLAVFLLLMLLKTALAIFYIPYLALGGELSRDYDERSSIQGVRAVFYLVGMILSIAGATLVFFRSTPAFPRGQLNPAAYSRMAVAFTAVILVTALISYASTLRYVPVLPRRVEGPGARPPSARQLGRDFGDALKNRELLLLVLMIFIIEAGFQFGIAIGFHVNTYTYGLTGPTIGLLALTVLGTSILSQPFWVAFTKRFEKKTALVVGLVIGFIGFIGAPWAHVWWRIFPIESPRLPWTLGLFMFIAGIGNGAFMSVPNAMISDAADLEQARTGRRDEGLYFGLYTFAYKMGTSISLVLSGAALGLIGFDPNTTVQSAATKFRLAMVPTYLLLATAPFALFFILRYRITRARWRQIQAALAESAARRPASG